MIFIIIFVAFVISGICTEIAERIALPVEKRLKQRFSNV